MNCTVYSKDGKELRTIELADAVFGLPVNEDLIWYAINNELDNKRQGNACTKDRGEVHGSKFHREPGSTGQSTYPHKTFKNVKLPGRMGREKVTVLSQRVIQMDTEKQLILVRGAVPGINKGLVFVRAAVKKWANG